MGIGPSAIDIETRVLPQLSGTSNRVDLGRFPPLRFIASTMEDTMVRTAKGHCELVADPAAQGARLCESQVMRVRRPASAQQAWLRGYELQVRTITISARFAQCERALVDVPGSGIVYPLCAGWSYGSR
jgi:hypothetical protein